MSDYPKLSTIIPKTGIKVAYFDNDGRKVGGITVEQANKVASIDPSKKFYFQNGDGIEQELSIGEVNQLSPTNLLPTASDCPTNSQVCGPPLVKFFGGGGFGAAANAIISPISSSVIGFDIVNPGFGFLDDVSAELIDPCGKGSGSKLQVNLEEDDEDTSNIDSSTNSQLGSTNTSTFAGSSGAGEGGTRRPINPCDIPKLNYEKQIIRNTRKSKKVKSITIIAPGDGYISLPDGSLGGNERVWKEPDEGYVKSKCGGQFVVQPYKPIPVKTGDTYFPPDGPPVTITEDQVITLPFVPVIPPSPEILGPSYPVILIIDEIVVLDPGFGYRPGDQLIITPDKGSSAELVINDNGQIDRVNVLNPGIGFTDLPALRTNSTTGFNAAFSVILRPIRIDVTRPIEEQIPGRGLGEEIEVITVIDCVGRVLK